MGCCGCSLATSTVTAVVLGLLESIIGLSWNILVIVVMSQKTNFNETFEDHFNLTTTTAPEVEYSADDSSTSQEYYLLWRNLNEKLKSDPQVQHEHIFEVVVAALVLNSLWLITTLGLAVGNAEKCRDMLKPWIGTTLIITVTDIAATVYFIIKAVKSEDEMDVRTAFFTNLFVFCAVMFSRGGIVIWIINIALCVFVAQRVKELGSMKTKRMPFDSDFHIMPYSLNSPYAAFETETSSRNAKNFRPHTPPPDYEGPGKHRRPSFSSEPETMTLPISMTSSHGSLAQRPLSAGSYIYDDRVELQHRASCAAETVLHHAYENKGLVMDAEGWMGIPRPTLKSSSHQ
ncbi:uncharacterized protein LOC129224119 [Uloborus diversus]|uniref:uncharacterized protein LOC129224119 n=1 Tax=Uloborus diversus TaxID=327109 RepID=UPI00240A6CAC|nr:uncharacterized protein LOC129224119 [Uloborus diversus]